MTYTKTVSTSDLKKLDSTALLSLAEDTRLPPGVRWRALLAGHALADLPTGAQVPWSNGYLRIPADA
jgi:hypothetical protein